MPGNGKNIRSHRQLEVYQTAFDCAMQIFRLSRAFPLEERFALTDQIRRSSRSVAANIAEAWRKRRYEAAFIRKLSDAEPEATETRVWIEFAVRCQYIDRAEGAALYRTYERLIASIINMITHADAWLIRQPARQ